MATIPDDFMTGDAPHEDDDDEYEPVFFPDEEPADVSAPAGADLMMADLKNRADSAMLGWELV